MQDVNFFVDEETDKVYQTTIKEWSRGKDNTEKLTTPKPKPKPKAVKRKRGKLIKQEVEVMKKTCTTTTTNFGRGGKYKAVSPLARGD